MACYTLDMSLEKPALPIVPSRRESLLGILHTKPETIDDLDLSMLFLEVNGDEFTKIVRTLGKMGKTFSLVFVMDDLGETLIQKRLNLRRLKAIRENSGSNKVVTSVTIKGNRADINIEPNVFASDVKFEQLD